MEGFVMSYQKPGSRGQSFLLVLNAFLNGRGLPFADILSEQQIHDAFEKEDALFGQQEGDVYTPALTLLGFLSQVMQTGADRTCKATVKRLRNWCLALGIRGPSPDTGAYCRARAKLPNVVLQDLTYAVADELEAQMPPESRWHGHCVKIVDGSTVMAPDTEENQEVWPQMASQQPGLGFPILRFCVLMSLATGALGGLELGPYQGKETGETALLRELFDRLNSGDILLGDTAFCSYFMIALELERGVQSVTQQHQCRTTDFKEGKRLGKGDHVVCWTKPERPDWMDEATYQRMPEELEVRELEVQVQIPGFRTKKLVVVTTLTDAKRYPKADLAQLYRDRWHVELDLRALKVHLQMEDLRGKTPEMVKKEIWGHCLAYNLIRKSMCQAACLHECQVRQLSFMSARQSVRESWSASIAATPELLDAMTRSQLDSIAYDRVGKRPNRVEPRAVKRRPRKQKLLTKPRDKARAELSESATAG
jgi:hypothetical protein